jgi:hypothetical protein
VCAIRGAIQEIQKVDADGLVAAGNQSPGFQAEGTVFTYPSTSTAMRMFLGGYAAQSRFSDENGKGMVHCWIGFLLMIGGM